MKLLLWSAITLMLIGLTAVLMFCVQVHANEAEADVWQALTSQDGLRKYGVRIYAYQLRGLSREYLVNLTQEFNVEILGKTTFSQSDCARMVEHVSGGRYTAMPPGWRGIVRKG